MNARLPIVAVVGRPNVGKSSLVNRILGRREAIVEATPGVTRDRSSFVAEWRDRTFELVDTGGLERRMTGLEARAAEQATLAISYADVVLFVVDVTAGILDDDVLVADILRKSSKPVLLVANKVDDAPLEANVAEFYRLGLGDPRPVSALHGRGSGDLLDVLVETLPSGTDDATGQWAAIAIVGRPNVGKSSLLNALAGTQRALVDPAPGTTRDPVDVHLTTGQGSLRVVDTAGMRREVQIKDPLEYFSFLRSRRTLERVDAAILVVDVQAGATGHDQRIAEEIEESGRACVVVLNKWDLLPDDEIERERALRRVDERLRFLWWAPKIRTSAVTGRGVDKIVPAAERAIAAHRTRVPTAEVNRSIAGFQEERPHPRVGGRAARILYGVQKKAAPPTFLLFATQRLETSYLRYVERKLRATADFEGTPIAIEVRVRTRREVERSR
ncbi:MAG: ribosome biogenesis GTPase Der [Actinomycetota bacterium]|nr:ribosome biogenesis GTPase Der [Actinomycetota bacterium]